MGGSTVLRSEEGVGVTVEGMGAYWFGMMMELHVRSLMFIIMPLHHRKTIYN